MLSLSKAWLQTSILFTAFMSLSLSSNSESIGIRDSTSSDERKRIASEMIFSIQNELLNKWYPQSVDKQHGGFLSTFTYDFQPTGPQDKFIVTQARHTWTTAKASELYPEKPEYKAASLHGLSFLKDVMWDKEFGGFHSLVNREGAVSQAGGFASKEAYGNSFALYALAANYKATGDTSALNLARKAFYWLEEHSHDPVYKGYFQHMGRNGSPIKRTADIPSTSDRGYKDQNTSIHLLEAFTELYTIWPDKLVKERLLEMLFLIRDKITNPKGYLNLYFLRDWTPVTYYDSTDATVLKHHYIDHVSFGHDVETAYLMLEASHVAGIRDDTLTMKVAKRMVDHALKNGWDSETGGFYDEGYYFKGRKGISIIKDTKNWWAQAEGLNTLLLMADHFPKDEMNYFEKFKKLWEYSKAYLIDHRYGDWYQGGLDKEPERKTDLKGHIWKGNYHQYRALSSCILRLNSRYKN